MTTPRKPGPLERLLAGRWHRITMPDPDRVMARPGARHDGWQAALQIRRVARREGPRA
jgi:hypothetical protein